MIVLILKIMKKGTFLNRIIESKIIIYIILFIIIFFSTDKSNTNIYIYILRKTQSDSHLIAFRSKKPYGVV